ncbi:S8 family serine peptidase [Dyadobacter sp. LHD-138]|uniref:S8 family serine peptidase n=1 Tax=Dyadobacter sp. LHD-138 TaxID=3071413 RepID=UPI0027E0A93C|nr:S8 family serine peptidase [Dyadobacter sp. LHD-138]MDQ6482418.1 caspase family protein [Dyadobacter sp. LHD-138]
MKTNGISLHIGLNAVSPLHYAGWAGELHAAENDAKSYQEIAIKAGYEHKTMLTKDATSEALVEFLTEASAKLTGGQTLFLSYSGHGGSVIDVNKDEVNGSGELDGFDETWCLYDRQFLDDELYECFAKFAEGVRILIFSDSCHSGSIAKVANDENEHPDTTNPALYKKSRMTPLGVLFKTYNNNVGLYSSLQKEKPTTHDDIPAFVLQFGACQDNEVAFEVWGNGLFTSKVVEVLQSPVKDYSDFFKKIKTGFSNNQNPNLFKYGNKQHDFTTFPPFVLDGTITANEPLLKSIEENSIADSNDELILELYHSSTKNESEISRSAPTRSVVEKGVQSKDNGDRFVIEEVSSGIKSWDKAYESVLKDNRLRFVEPNVKSPYLKRELARSENQNEYLQNWPQPESNETEFIWHLDDKHSQLRSAQLRVTESNANAIVRIGHIDTGYLPDHPSTPVNVKKDWAVSFVKDEYLKNPGIDKMKTGSIGEQDGHGCATLAILAGKKIEADGTYPKNTGDFGAIPFAEVIPIRICETVFNTFSANDVARGIDYAVDYGCEVITMSMAGYPTRRVAEAINRAYDNGVIVVTAAGNNFTKGLGKLAPKAVLYPARFSRVIAATGACYNDQPYDFDANSLFRLRSAGGEHMQGNWGPQSAMKKALAGYTPNVAWASSGQFKFRRSGGGTSCATPQVAAAAALWIAHNREKIQKAGIQNNWKKVEAARSALFSSADKSFPAFRKYYGNGIVRALDALEAFDFNKVHELVMSEKAKVGFLGLGDFFSGWFRSKSTQDSKTVLDMVDYENIKEMISLELLQLIHIDPELMSYAEELDFENDETATYFSDISTRKAFAEKVVSSSYASDFLKQSVNASL